MTNSEKLQFGSLLVTMLAFVASQFWTILQRSKQDRRAKVKLGIFQTLGANSMKLDRLKEIYHKEHGRISDADLEKAIYEMLVDGTAYYELSGTYRAHWRTPKMGGVAV